MTRIRRAGAAIAAGTLVLAVAGCHGDGSPAASAGTASPGGTLNVLMNGTELASLDPATSNSQASQDISPLIISPLTIVQPDSSPSKIVLPPSTVRSPRTCTRASSTRFGLAPGWLKRETSKKKRRAKDGVFRRATLADARRSWRPRRAGAHPAFSKSPSKAA